MSIAPSLFSSDETHCCASKRQENICCTHVLFLLLDYQVHTRQQCPGIPILTLEHLQDTAENMKCNHLLPKTPPCTSYAGCPTLDVQQLLCQLVVKQQKVTAKFKTFRAAQHSAPAQHSALLGQHTGLASAAVPLLPSCPGAFSTGKQFSLVLSWEGRGVHGSSGGSITRSFQQLAELVSLKFFHSKFVI